MIHATAGSSSAGAVSVMADGKASFHWLVPDENEDQHGDLVWACAPESRAAWHVKNSRSHPDVNGGANRVNHWSLGIEVVNSQISDPFSDWQVEATARIVRYCWAKYPNLVHVVSHAKLDPDRRSDPGAAFPWERFQALVLNGTDDTLPASVATAPHASTLQTRTDREACCMPASDVEMPFGASDAADAFPDPVVAEFNRFIKAPDDSALGREDILRMLAYREREEFFVTAAAAQSSIRTAAVAPLPKPDALVAMLSPESREAIVGFETGGKSYYNGVIKERPIWPGGQSGVTIGFGYDLGYNSKGDFKSNWQQHLSASDFALLAGTIGLTGAAAKAAIRKVDHIRIPWGVGLSVFDVTTLPKFTFLTFERLPGLLDLAQAGLHGHCLGVLVSLVFNRGPSFSKSGGHYKEMRAIREAIETGTTATLSTIPQHLRDMKRLWKNKGLDGLLARREAEAVLFEQGLSVTPRLPVAAATAASSVVAMPVAPPSPASVVQLARQDEDAPEVFAALEALPPEERDRLLLEPGLGEGEEMVEPAPSFAIAAAPAFTKADVAWVKDDRNHPDYRHLPPNAAGSTFSFTPEDLERMIAANHFDPQTGSHGKIVFALRGALLVGTGNSQQNRSSLSLQDVRPDHKAFRCVIGIYDRTSKQLSGYTASTVPNAGGVLAQYNGTLNANLLPTGCYELCVGTHFGSVTVKGVFRLGNGPMPANAGQATVLRTRNDVTYGNQDVWDPCKPADNIHPAFGTTAFSSLGCLTVMGSYQGSGKHTGEWANFRNAAGLDSGNGPGTRFDLVLLTGLDAATAVTMRLAGKSSVQIDEVLLGLRHGSKGAPVSALQSALGLTPDGEFGPGTKSALAQAQLAKLGFATGIYSLEMDGDMGFGIF